MNQQDFDQKYSENFGIVLNLALKFSPCKSNLEDFISEGKIALINSIKSFDLKKGTKFSTFCYSCVKNRMIDFSRKQRKIILIPLSKDWDIPDKNLSVAKEKFIDCFSKLSCKEKRSFFSEKKSKEDKRNYNSVRKKMKSIKFFS